MDLSSPRVPKAQAIGGEARAMACGRGSPSYSNTLQPNNSKLNFDTRDNSILYSGYYCDILEDYEPPQYEDTICPTLLVTTQEKRMCSGTI